MLRLVRLAWLLTGLRLLLLALLLLTLSLLALLPLAILLARVALVGVVHGMTLHVTGDDQGGVAGDKTSPGGARLHRVAFFLSRQKTEHFRAF